MAAPIRIALMGCQGRMGKALLEAIQNNNQVALGAALERPGSTVIGLDVGDLNGLGAMNVLVADDLEKVKDQFDVIIDFTRPEVTLKNLAFRSPTSKPITVEPGRSSAAPNAT
jgi:4-hydroxy-tetrahydrodipicolinate reductase